MNYWLLKTERSTYAWEDLLKDTKTRWDGVRNFQARNNLRAMKKGDLALFYHSGDEKTIVGIARITTEAYPDPTAKEGDWSVVDIEPVVAFKKPVSLSSVKQDGRFDQLVLVKNSRLSVQPVDEKSFKMLSQLGE